MHTRLLITALVSTTLATAALAEEGGPPSPPSQSSLPAGVSVSGSTFAFPNGQAVEGQMNLTETYTFGVGFGPANTGQLVTWGNADSMASLQNKLSPDPSVFAGVSQTTYGRSSASIGMGYRVLLTATDAAAADAIQAMINNGDALATVNGQWRTTADGYGYSSVSAATGFDVPDLDNAMQESAGQVCGAYGLVTAPGTAGCGDGSFSLGIHFVSTADMIGGNALSFVSSIWLFASANAGTAGAIFTPYPGTASAFVDPTVTLASGVNATLVLGDNGNVANPVPEPASWALMLAGTAGLLAWRRRATR